MEHTNDRDCICINTRIKRKDDRTRYKDSLQACLYSKRIAKQEVNPDTSSL